MTVRLSPGSPRRAIAERFGRELDRAMKARGVGAKSLAKQLGIASSAIGNWRCGDNLPRLETAQRLASGLSAPLLLEIAREGRTGTCEECGRSFANQGGAPKRYCSSQCREIATKIRTAKGTTRQRAAVAERRLADHVAAVAAMCTECEPEGLCRTAECPLRGVSPLPLARRDDDAMPVQKPAGAWGDRDRMLTVVREANGRRWSRDGERERQSAQNTERWASMTPQEREAVGRRISAKRAGVARGGRRRITA